MKENVYNIEDVFFFDLYISASGGAVYISRASVDVSFLSDSFIWCRLDGNDYVGGGFYVNVSNVSVLCSSFERCYAYNEGSAFRIDTAAMAYTISSFSVDSIKGSEYNIIQDCAQMFNQGNNIMKSGNFSRCTPKECSILKIHANTSAPVAKITFMNFDSSSSQGNRAFFYLYSSASFESCNFLDISAHYLFAFNLVPKITITKSVFDGISIRSRGLNPVLSFTFFDCFVVETSIASILGVSPTESIDRILINPFLRCQINENSIKSFNFNNLHLIVASLIS